MDPRSHHFAFKRELCGAFLGEPKHFFTSSRGGVERANAYLGGIWAFAGKQNPCSPSVPAASLFATTAGSLPDGATFREVDADTMLEAAERSDAYGIWFNLKLGARGRRFSEGFVKLLRSGDRARRSAA